MLNSEAGKPLASKKKLDQYSNSPQHNILFASQKELLEFKTHLTNELNTANSAQRGTIFLKQI